MLQCSSSHCIHEAVYTLVDAMLHTTVNTVVYTVVHTVVRNMCKIDQAGFGNQRDGT